jgi:hypothetical protein
MIYRKGDIKMFTDYRLNKTLWIEEIFDGRLEHYGVHETFVEDAKPDFRCLTDGNNVLWIEEDEEIDFMFGFGLLSAMEKILTAIEEAFDAEIFSEHQTQYWGNETGPECRCDRKKAVERVQSKLNILIMGYVRRKSRYLEPCSSFESVVNIANDLIIENPDLASPGREAELLEKTNMICMEKYNSTLSVKKLDMKTATHLGYFLH